MGICLVHFLKEVFFNLQFTHFNFHFYRYESILTECQETYVSVRQSLIGPSVTKTMESLVPTSASGITTALDHCSLMRSACAFLVHLSLDEHRLYKQFFSTQTDIFKLVKTVSSFCSYFPQSHSFQIIFSSSALQGQNMLSTNSRQNFLL